MRRRKIGALTPVCWGCGEKPARKLLAVTARDYDAVFCSVECAARSALEDAAADGLHWCQDHADWQTHDRPCSGCALARQEEDAAAHLEALEAKIAVEEVTHE